MKIVVDWNRCQGIGICESIMPDVFEVDQDGQMVLHTDNVMDGEESAAADAVASCPSEALSLEE